MKREIKFRFWDTKKRIWCGWEISGWISFDKRNDPRQVVTLHAQTDDVIVMQFTGLLDKNGKECYFGDWVKTLGKVFEVTWNDAGFIELKETLGKAMYQWAPGTWISKGEVIGNIYENPELLK